MTINELLETDYVIEFLLISSELDVIGATKDYQSVSCGEQLKQAANTVLQLTKIDNL